MRGTFALVRETPAQDPAYRPIYCIRKMVRSWTKRTTAAGLHASGQRTEDCPRCGWHGYFQHYIATIGGDWGAAVCDDFPIRFACCGS